MGAKCPGKWKLSAFTLIMILSWTVSAYDTVVVCPIGCLCTAHPSALQAIQPGTPLHLDMVCPSGTNSTLIPEFNVNLTITPESALTELQFTGSYLTEVPVNICNYTHIQNIDLSNNQITQINSNHFACVAFLQSLNLANNNLTTLSQSFLERLSFLKFLDISHNQIRFISSGTFHSGLRHLEVVDLRHNQLTQFEPWPFVLKSIRVFEVSNNLISGFANSMHWKLSDSSPFVHAYIGMQENQMTKLSMEDFRIYGITSIKDLWLMRPLFGYFDLRNNPLICDCNVYDFVNIMKEIAQDSTVHRTFQMQFYDVTCKQPSNLQGLLMMDLKQTDFVCTDIPRCPPGCSCVYKAHLRQTLVDCQGVGLETLPDSIPENGSLILKFQNNVIQKLVSRSYLQRAIEIYLSSNRIDYVDDEAVKEMMNLKLLHLDHNQLTVLPDTFKAIVSPRVLLLTGNQMRCNCDTTWLAAWLRNASQSAGLSGYMCMEQDLGAAQPFLQITDDLLDCLYQPKPVGIYILITIILIGFVVLICCAVVFRKWLKVFAYLYLRIHPFDTLPDDDQEERRIDVYLSYHTRSDDVEKWIQDVFIKQLESKSPVYKVFSNIRDGGRPTTRNLIAERMAHSKRHVVILTEDFAEHYWSMFEFREAVLQERLGRGKRMVLILYTDSVLRVLDPGISEVAKKHPCLIKEGKWFWEELEYLMPPRTNFNLSNRVRNWCGRGPMGDNNTPPKTVWPLSSSLSHEFLVRTASVPTASTHTGPSSPTSAWSLPANSEAGIENTGYGWEAREDGDIVSTHIHDQSPPSSCPSTAREPPVRNARPPSFLKYIYRSDAFTSEDEAETETPRYQTCGEAEQRDGAP